MQETIRGIVLRTVKYGDSSLIVDLFTLSYGRLSLMTSISRAKRAVRSVSFWQPLSLLEFQSEVRAGGTSSPLGGVRRGLPRPADVRAYYNYVDLPFSPLKSTLALFLAEFLSAALREEKENEPLYRYIESSLQWLDLASQPSSIANFHLVFLMHLSRFIGIYPNLELGLNLNPQSSTLNSQLYFDLLAGTYCDRQPTHAHFLHGAEAAALPTLFRMDYSTMHLFRFSRSERQRILHVLNLYYRLHIPNFPELKSLEVLHELYS